MSKFLSSYLFTQKWRQTLLHLYLRAHFPLSQNAGSIISLPASTFSSLLNCMASLFLAFTLMTLHFLTSVLSVFSASLFVLNCTCLCVEEIKATSSAKSRTSSFDVNFHLSPVPSLTVCLITQSIMSRESKPDIVHPCLTPVVSSNHSEIASSSTTADSKPCNLLLYHTIVILIFRYILFIILIPSAN